MATQLQLTFSVAGQPPQTVAIDQPRMIIGTLLSNQVVLRAAGVDPIHALIEEVEGEYSIVDLGSSSGITVNSENIDVEHMLKPGDTIRIGSVDLVVQDRPVAPLQGGLSQKLPPPPGGVMLQEGTPPKSTPKVVEPTKKPENLAETVPATKTADDRVIEEKTTPVGATASPPKTGDQKPTGAQRQDKRDLLFSPRKARPSGDVLEVVAYWDNTVLDVDLFHPALKGYEKVTIGDPTKKHFIAAGPDDVDHHTLCQIGDGGYKIRLLKGMEARMRRGGKVETVKGPGSHKMGRRDIAHIKYGAVRYFVLFVRPPSIRLPRSGPRDPVVAMLGFVAMLLYMVAIPALWIGDPVVDERDPNQEVWLPIPKEITKPKPTPRPPVVKKPPIKIAEKKEKAQPKPPKPKKPTPEPKPPTQKAPPKPVKNPKQTKPVEKPAVDNLKKRAAPNKNTTPRNNNKKSQGMGKVSNKPDFKKPGPKNKNKSPKSGGAKGQGNNNKGGQRKGKDGASHKGVEGVKNKRASGVNLSKLGLGAGKILKKNGPGAIRTNLRNSVGGAGGGAGHGSKTKGLGGIGNSGSIGLAGTGGATNNFGAGTGGFGSGNNGRGGLGGVGSGKGSGRVKANIAMPTGDAAVSGGLTRQEISAVIRTNLNQIRHCYENLLQKSPSARGKMKVMFVIGANGRVTSTKTLQSSITDSVMKGCVNRAIKRWKFPPPRGASSVNVRYPFVFNPI